MDVPNNSGEAKRQAGVSVPSVPMSGAVASFDPTWGAPSESPLRLIVIMVGWLVLAYVVPRVAAYVAFLIGDRFAPQAGLVPIAWMVGYYGVLLRAAFVRARIVGEGDVRAGLGDAPISRWSIIAAIVILTIAGAALVIAAYYYGYIETSSRSPARERSLSEFVFRTFDIVVIAPLIEECFFRGWLWTGLRKHWSPFATSLVTGAFFVACHGPKTFASFGHHVAATTLLSLARHFGGSVRASIVVHVIWNLAVIATAVAFGFLSGDN